MRLAVVGVMLLVALPTAASLGPLPTPLPSATTHDDPLSDLLSNVTPENATKTVYRTTGNNLTREDVAVNLGLDFRTLDFDMLGVVFGGGTLQAQARVKAHLEFRVLSVSRITDAVKSVAGDQVNTSLADQQYLTANEFRATLGAEAIAAFEGAEQKKVEQMLGDMLPDVTILSSQFAWSNTDPNKDASAHPELDITNPTRPVKADLTGEPVVLDTTFDVQYLTRESLWGVIQDSLHKTAAEKQEKDAKQKVLDKLRAENEGAFYERSAFDVLGISQVLVPSMPPGWKLQTDVLLPKGYTIEYASPDVAVDGAHQAAHTVTSASYSDVPVANPVALSLSSRYLVTVALLGITFLVGALLRFPAIAIATKAHHAKFSEKLKHKTKGASLGVPPTDPKA